MTLKKKIIINIYAMLIVINLRINVQFNYLPLMTATSNLLLRSAFGQKGSLHLFRKFQENDMYYYQGPVAGSHYEFFELADRLSFLNELSFLRGLLVSVIKNIYKT